MFLGHYSTDALGAAQAVMGVFWTPLALLQQTAAYVTTFVAQYFGSNQKSMIGPSLWQALHISVVGGLLVLALIPVAPWFFELVGHSPNVQRFETEYFEALCWSALPMALVAALSGFYTGLGRTKIIMILNCIGLVFNVIFDYLLIFGNYGFPEMGIYGAGIATALANWAAAFFGLYLVFFRNESSVYGLNHWKINTDLMRRFLKFGVPSGLQWALEGLAFTVFMIILGRMENGSAALSGSSIAITVMMLAALPALGIAQAVSVLVGQYLGQKEPRNAEVMTYSGFQVAAMYIAVVATTFIIFPDFYINWFKTPDNAGSWGDVSLIARHILMFVALFTIFDSMNFVFSFALKGAGDTRFVTAVALLMPWPLMILPTYLFRNHSHAIYLAWGAASVYIVTQALVFWLRFRGNKWKEMSVISSST